MLFKGNHAMKSTFLSAMVVLGLATAASAESLYAVYPENCVYGPGGEGNVSIGNGQFHLGESQYDRVSERVASGDGYFQATYSQMTEGEPVGQTVMSLRITDARVDIKANGQTVTATLCNR
jgi:opacity protein-like surface antigen